jgi:Tol biopolymer transport system component
VIPSLNQVRIGRRVVHVQPKAMRLLLVLAETPRRLVTREQLSERVWDSRFPTDEVIARTVASLRKSLGDDSKDPKFIETIPKQGYRLIAKVTRKQKAAARWLTVLVASLTLAALGWTNYKRRVEMRGQAGNFELTARIAVGLSGYEEAPAIGPYGERLAFSYAPRESPIHRIHVASLGPSVDGPAGVGQQGFDDRYPVWSPTGDELAFIRKIDKSRCAILRVNLATGTERLVIDCNASIITPVDWSPDGENIVYSDQNQLNPGQYRLMAVSAMGGKARQLTTNDASGLSDWWPRVSPDGQRIAHIRGNLHEQRIFLTPIQGGKPQLWGGGGEGFLYGMSWMEDGSGLVYTFRGPDGVFSLWHLAMGESQATELGGRDWALPSIGNGQLAAVRLNHDLDVFRIDLNDEQSQSMSSVFDSSGIDEDPALSPDGSKAVLISNRSGVRALWLVDVDHDATRVGREIFRPENGLLRSPTWSWDGEHIALVERAGSRSAIWLVEMKGQTARRIYQGQEQLASPGFTNDGALLFGSDRSGQWQIWRLDLIDGGINQVTKHGGYRARQSEDGRWMYFSKYLSDGLFRMPIQNPDEERLLVPEATWLNRENWHATKRGLIVPLDGSEGREAGLYLVDEAADIRLIARASLYQSVKPDQSVSIDHQGSTALIVRPAFFQGNIVLVPTQSLQIPW